MGLSNVLQGINVGQQTYERMRDSSLTASGKDLYQRGLRANLEDIAASREASAALGKIYSEPFSAQGAPTVPPIPATPRVAPRPTAPPTGLPAVPPGPPTTALSVPPTGLPARPVPSPLPPAGGGAYVPPDMVNLSASAVAPPGAAPTGPGAVGATGVPGARPGPVAPPMLAAGVSALSNAPPMPAAVGAPPATPAVPPVLPPGTSTVSTAEDGDLGDTTSTAETPQATGERDTGYDSEPLPPEILAQVQRYDIDRVVQRAREMGLSPAAMAKLVASAQENYDKAVAPLLTAWTERRKDVRALSHDLMLTERAFGLQGARAQQAMRIEEMREGAARTKAEAEETKYDPPGDPRLTGDEYVASVPPEKRHLVDRAKAVLAGKEVLPPSSRNTTTEQVRAMVRQIDPEFDAALAGNRVRTLRDPRLNQALTSGTTVVGHLQEWAEALKDLDTTDVRAANAAWNAFRNQFGSAATTQGSALKTLVSEEMARFYHGGSPPVHAVRAFETIFDPRATPAQGRAALETMIRAMADQEQSLRENALARGVTTRDWDNLRANARVRQLFYGGKAPSEYGVAKYGRPAPGPGPATPSSAPTTRPGSADPAWQKRQLDAARRAIAGGADKAAVIKHLQDNGVTLPPGFGD